MSIDHTLTAIRPGEVSNLNMRKSGEAAYAVLVADKSRRMLAFRERRGKWKRELEAALKELGADQAFEILDLT